MTFDPETIERFGRLMRDNIKSGAIPFRKPYLQAVIERIEVDDDVVRIVGNTATLEQAIAGGAASPKVFADLYRSGAPEEIRTPDP